LIESDPHTAGQRAGESDEPGVLVIVRSAGLACRGNLKPNERALAAVPLVNTSSITSEVIQAAPGSTACEVICAEINRFVLLIVDALDDVRLPAHSGVGKHSVSGSQIFQVALERTDVAGRAVRNVLSNAEVVRDFCTASSPANCPTRTLMVLRE
jgi:hypothetical protein